MIIQLKKKTGSISLRKDKRTIELFQVGRRGPTGVVQSVVAGTGIDVDSSDPASPEVSLNGITLASLALANTAVQPDDLAAVATSGDYNDLLNKPPVGDMFSSVYDPQGIESDAFARSNHTGTQGISTVTGLQPALDSKANLAGGNTFNGAQVFNDDGADVDFRIEGTGDADLFKVDASTNSVLINVGTGDGDAKFWVANGVARFDENFKFKKGSGEQVIVRHDPATGSGGTGFDLKFEAGNADMMNMRGAQKLEFANGTMAGGGVVFNENGNDTDVRIEGDTDANLLVTDASTDRVGIGTDTPDSKLEVNGDIEISENTQGLILKSPDATRWRIQVDNTGNITTTAI